jgi:urease accessory protein
MVSHSTAPSSAPPLVLDRRLGCVPGPADPAEGLPPALLLPLGADQRTSLRGRRQSACGRDLLLQLPRGPALEPGETLGSADDGPCVIVQAAPESLLVVRSTDPLALLRAAYHLGNRHVALEVRPGELRLLEDSVLATLLLQRGLVVARIKAPFLPEPGAYATGSHGHGTGADPYR